MTVSKQKVIVIIGGGPAGCATAIALLQAMKNSEPAISVVLLNARTNPAGETVGETIPPAATPIMRQLGCLSVLESGHHLECPGSVSIWATDEVGYNDFLFSPIGTGYHLDRQQFDSDLLTKAESLGCQIKQGWHLRRVRKHDQGYELECTTEPPANGAAPIARNTAQRSSLSSNIVIDASGKSSAFTRRIGIARNVFDEVISVCAFFDLPEIESPPPAYTLVQSQENGWWYAARLPNNKAIVAFCTDMPALKQYKPTIATTQWHELFSHADWFSTECEKQFGKAIGVPDRLVLKPAPSAILSAVTGDSWLAVGDAASSYDSLTSAGITKAMGNGAVAGQAVAHWFTSGDREKVLQYQNSVFEEFNRYVQLHAHHYNNRHRYAHCGFWRRRREL